MYKINRHSKLDRDLEYRIVVTNYICLDVAQEMLTMLNNDSDLLKKIMTGDESWVYGYDIQTKAQSSHWKRPEQNKTEKARKVRSNVKVSLTVFFDCNGVVHHEFLPQGRTVNKKYYLEVIRLHTYIPT